jgi:hypothetical protein
MDDTYFTKDNLRLNEVKIDERTLLTLGALTIKGLQALNGLCFFISASQEILVAPIFEVQLDLLPEEQALEVLLARDYDDAKLKLYLQGRDARLRQGSPGFHGLT